MVMPLRPVGINASRALSAASCRLVDSQYTPIRRYFSISRFDDLEMPTTGRPRL